MFSKRHFCHQQLRRHVTSLTDIRRPKKKVALLVGFNGSDYQGMQANPGIRSIDKALFDALCQAGGISKLNSSDQSKVGWQRAARTDKGVHAVGNVVSLKMITEDPELVSKVNALLPNQIRVWGYVLTQNSFHAKKLCDSRQYEYLLPTYTLISIKDERRRLLDYQRQHRISAQRLDEFKKAVAVFVGTHKFHNYTIRRDESEMYVKRHIKGIHVSEPVIAYDGSEWIRIRLHGQSFMLHQIRKMMAMALLTVRSNAPTTIIEETFGKRKINIPKAPALGLLLDRPVYDQYNKIIDPSKREPISFDKYEGTMQVFKEQYIDHVIFSTESEERLFNEFLELFDFYGTTPENGAQENESALSYMLNNQQL